MANRLTKITTRTGDNGTTGLGDGTRVGKDSARIAAMGEVDELNAQLGLLLCLLEQPKPQTKPTETEQLTQLFTKIQHDLFELGAELCIPGHQALTPQHISQLEEWITHYNNQLNPLREFILPGGCHAAAQAHVARTVCRRAERSVVSISKDPTEIIADTTKQYLNRLSDLLFILARVLNQQAGISDVLWQR